MAVLAAAELGHITEEGELLRELQLGVAGHVVPVPLGQARALSRERLDQALLDAARSTGATVRLGTRAELGPVGAGSRTVVLHRSGERTQRPCFADDGTVETLFGNQQCALDAQ